jgi:hypothetical protein
VAKLAIKPGLADELNSMKGDHEGSLVRMEEARFVDQIMVTTLGTGSAAPSKYRNGMYFSLSPFCI